VAQAGAVVSIANNSKDEWILTTTDLGQAPVAMVNGDGTRDMFKGGRLSLEPYEVITFEFLSWGTVKPAKYRELEMAAPSIPVRRLAFSVVPGQGGSPFCAGVWVDPQTEAVRIGVCARGLERGDLDQDRWAGGPRLLLGSDRPRPTHGGSSPRPPG